MVPPDALRSGGTFVWASSWRRHGRGVGEYPSSITFLLSPLIQPARDLIKGSKATTFLVMLASVASVVAYVLLTTDLSGGPQPVPDPRDPSNLVDAIVPMLLGAVFAPAVVAIGLERSAGRPVTFAGVMAYARFAPHFFILGAIGFLTQFFLLSALWPLQQLFNVAFSVLTQFAAFYVVDAGLGAFAALGASLRLVAANLGQVLLLFLLNVALGFLGVVTLGIGLIWIVPFSTILTALVYRQVSEPRA